MMSESVSKIMLEEVDATNNEGESPILPKDLNLFGHVKVEVTVQVGHLEMDIEKLMSLKKDDVLSLEQTVDAPVILLIGQKPIARANLVAVDDNFGVEITEMIE